MSKIGDKRHYPIRLKDIEQEEDEKKEIRESRLVDQENEGISKRINNQRIPTFE